MKHDKFSNATLSTSRLFPFIFSGFFYPRNQFFGISVEHRKNNTTGFTMHQIQIAISSTIKFVKRLYRLHCHSIKVNVSIYHYYFWWSRSFIASNKLKAEIPNISLVPLHRDNTFIIAPRYSFRWYVIYLKIEQNSENQIKTAQNRWSF